jgi:hypothetical protein
VGRVSYRDDVQSSADLFRGFREEEPRRARAMRFRTPRAVAVMGRVEFIGYMTTHGRKTYLYVHQFAVGSRPIFAAGAGRNQAFMLGGRYRVTDRGIVDFDAAGREVRARERYKIEVIRR